MALIKRKVAQQAPIVQPLKKVILANDGLKKGMLYRPMIRSRHPSHNGLRLAMERLPFRSVIRMGSSTPLTDAASLAGTRIELNNPKAIANSSSKLKMKTCFTEAGVKTAQWVNGNSVAEVIRSLKNEDGETIYPFVAKHYFGSRGTGNTLIKSEEEFTQWAIGKNFSTYLFEKFCNFNKEYRLHVTKNGCFYSCRKMLKSEFKDHPNAWQRHDDNCVWIMEQNLSFDKPSNWLEIEEHCVNALKSCGLDFGACDLRVQNNTTEKGVARENVDFIVVEINSAPSFGEITLEKYKIELYNLLVDKFNNK